MALPGGFGGLLLQPQRRDTPWFLCIALRGSFPTLGVLPSELRGIPVLRASLGTPAFQAQKLRLTGGLWGDTQLGGECGQQLRVRECSAGALYALPYHWTHNKRVLGVWSDLN